MEGLGGHIDRPRCLEFIIWLMESPGGVGDGRDLVRLAFWKVIHLLRALRRAEARRPAKRQFPPPHSEFLAHT